MRSVVRSVLAGGILAALLATACTAFVSAQLKGLDDYPSDGAVGDLENACALLATRQDANACNDCITQSCSNELAYACNGGKDKKRWFSKMQECAQNPFEGRGALSWRCYLVGKYHHRSPI